MLHNNENQRRDEQNTTEKESNASEIKKSELLKQASKSFYNCFAKIIDAYGFPTSQNPESQFDKDILNEFKRLARSLHNMLWKEITKSKIE